MKRANKHNPETLNNCLLRKKSAAFIGEYIYIYSAIFAVMAFVILSIHINGGYSLIRNGDSFTQHHKALIYYAEYIRGIISALINEHRLVLPQWDFEIGMGSDIISTFSYYTLGDPFNIFSVFVPSRYMHYYYQVMIVVRYYLAGLSFSFLCFQTGNRSRLGVLAGAVTYCFSSYAIFAGLKHAYFINPMIFLPLVILGVEKILNGKSVLLMMAAVAVSAVSNFYFFYMIVLLTVVYVAVRIISIYKTDIRDMAKPFAKIVFASVTGVCISAVLFLPTVIAFVGDTRSLTKTAFELFYDLSMYKRLLLSFFSYGRASTWLAVCLSVLFLPCLIMLFIKRRQNTHLKALYIISLIFMSLPVFGRIFNGFSYVCHRWSFAYALLMSFIIVKMWDNLIRAGKKEMLLVCSGSFAVGAAVICLSDTRTGQLLLPFLLLAVCLAAVIFLGKKAFNKDTPKKAKAVRILMQLICLTVSVLSIFNYNYYMISEEHGNFVSEFRKSEILENESYPSNNAILEATKEDGDFWRYSGRKLSVNTSFLDSLKSTQYYWSLSNGYISRFRREMNMAENTLYYYQGYDDRTALNALASVKYFYNGDQSNASLPYGYNPISDTVSVNTLSLPLGYTYGEYISRAEFDALESSVAKQEILLNAALLEKDTDALAVTESIPASEKLDYEINVIKGKVKKEENRFVVSRANSKIEFIFDAVPESETYFCISNMGYSGTGKSKITLNLLSEDTAGNEYTKSFFYYTPEANFYSERTNFDVNLGYAESGICKLAVTFPYKGTYSFDSIDIISQPMASYEQAINRLKENVLENVKTEYNTVSGTIALSEDKLLCLSVPYSKGWKAYVNGEKAQLLQTNGMYCGLLLGEGEHKIELHYNTPGLKIGLIITCLGIGVFILTACYQRRKNRHT